MPNELVVSPANRRYGATRVAPHLNEPRAKYVRAAPLPPFVDLTAWDSPVRDQGAEGSCTGQSGAALVEWIWRKYYKKSPIISAAFLYAKELIMYGDFPADAGADPLATCRVLNEVGCCEEADMPYTPGLMVRPNAAQEASAAKYRLGGYHLLNGVEDYLSALGDPTPWCPTVAFDVYESFESDAVAATGVMTVPRPGERLLGGHQVKASGYDLTTGMALMKNSWGAKWGRNGYFSMPLEVLASATMRIIHPGHW